MKIFHAVPGAARYPEYLFRSKVIERKLATLARPIITSGVARSDNHLAAFFFTYGPSRTNPEFVLPHVGALSGLCAVVPNF